MDFANDWLQAEQNEFRKLFLSVPVLVLAMVKFL